MKQLVEPGDTMILVVKGTVPFEDAKDAPVNPQRLKEER